MKYKEKDRFNIELFFGKEKGNLLILLSKLKPYEIDNKIIYIFRNEEILEYEFDSKALIKKESNNFFKKHQQLYGIITNDILIECFEIITTLYVEKLLNIMYISVHYPDNILKSISHSITIRTIKI